MGNDISQCSAARAVFDEVNDSLGYDLFRIMTQGSDEDLRQTVNSQPALFAVSMATVRALESRGCVLKDHVRFVAGHSLGEYSALCAAGVLKVCDAAKLLHARGRLMQECEITHPGVMIALLGIHARKVQEIITQFYHDNPDADVCDIANDNSERQVVISGVAKAVQCVADLALKQGGKKAVKLNVSGAFHSRLMQNAAKGMEAEISATIFYPSAISVIMNTRAESVTDITIMKQALVDQICSTVRWRETVQEMINTGATHWIEVGAGKILSGLIPKTQTSLGGVSEISVIHTLQDVENFVQTVSE
jgi:[acyl-carrier-protein] S-malonyltransferase